MKIGIIGLGLIGGSIFKALESKYDVVAVSGSVQLPNVSDDYLILKGCNLVFVCTPMNITLDILDKIEPILTTDTIVTDVCSLKGFLSRKKYKYKFIPSHPMAGTENSGWEYSYPKLFDGAKWVITPLNGEILPEQVLLESVIKAMGANVIITNPSEHDEAVALISHLPLLVAQALCENIKDNKLAQELASSGFRDTTRLALSNTQMASDMVELNRQNIMNSFKKFEESMNYLFSNNYKEIAENIKVFRQKLSK